MTGIPLLGFLDFAYKLNLDDVIISRAFWEICLSRSPSHLQIDSNRETDAGIRRVYCGYSCAG
jgi:hypothetical protein